MKLQRIAFLLIALALTAAGCGGGTGGTGVSSGGSPAVSMGVMAKGSVIVNGVHFDDSTANIRIDDTPKLPIDLKDGMVVKVRGMVSDDGINGTAQQVEVEKEVRGTVQSTNPGGVPPSFMVIGQTVLVDDLTKFGGFITPPTSPSIAVGALTTASIVEVHGLRDTGGNIRASRVELLTPNLLGDELMGFVTGTPTPTTFVLTNGTVNVNVSYTVSAISPVGSPLTNGARVEVHGTFAAGVFNATLVELEDLEDVQFQHAEGEDFSVEGMVSGCAVNPCTTFVVKSQAVQTNVNTRFENGLAADLANNVQVEAEGHVFNGTTLIAEKIQFKRTRVILIGTATAVTGTIVNGTGNTGSITVLGNTVQITALTEVVTNNNITTERVEVRGYVDSSGIIVAERLDDTPSGNANRVTIQARVTGENLNILTLLGINADVTGATFLNASEQTITRDVFLSAVTPAPAPGGTLVKVQGTLSGSTIAVLDAELEN